jgi:hypothetical protein
LPDDDARHGGHQQPTRDRRPRFLLPLLQLLPVALEQLEEALDLPRTLQGKRQLLSMGPGGRMGR